MAFADYLRRATVWQTDTRIGMKLDALTLGRLGRETPS